MRKIRAVETNLRTEPTPYRGIRLLRRDYVEPEPVGTILLMPFRITGYSQDCDGEALGELENLMYWDGKLEDSGWHTDRVAIYPSSGFVTSEDELCRLFQSSDDAQEE